MSSPAIKLRDGCLQVVVWRNTNDRGTFYTFTPQRFYRQGDETWRETDSLNESNLLAMAKLLRESYAWIRMQKRADAKGIRERDKATAR
jgi:hypothetical protein